VLAQALLLSYLLLEAAFAFAPAAPRRAFVLSLSVVALGSGLPWFVSQLMPDLFTGVMALGLALLALAPLPWPRRLLVGCITLMAIAAHASHLGTAAILGLAVALLAWRVRDAFSVRVWAPALVVMLGLLATPLAHRVTTGEFYLRSKLRNWVKRRIFLAQEAGERRDKRVSLAKS